MKFALIAALMGATLASTYEDEDNQEALAEDDDQEDDTVQNLAQESDSESSEEEASKYTGKEQSKASSHVKDPNVKARFEYARDACKTVPDKKKKACFTRNWRLYKPAHNNTIHDYRARAHRKCW